MQKNSTQLTECAEHDATIKDGIKRLSNTVQKCDFENYFEESLWFSWGSAFANKRAYRTNVPAQAAWLDWALSELLTPWTICILALRSIINCT